MMIDLTTGPDFEVQQEDGEGTAVSAAYRDRPIAEFLEWSRTNNDAWLLIDRTSQRFVSSPRFRGAYWDTETGAIANTLAPLIRLRAARGLQIVEPRSLAWSISRDCSVAAAAFPVTTPIRNVRPIFACMTCEGVTPRSYLPPPAHGYMSDDTFREALIEAAARYAGGNATICFSGGKDALAVFLAMGTAVPRKQLRAVYVDHAFFGGERDQAQAIADRLVIPLEVRSLAGGWAYGGDDGRVRLETLLSSTLSNATSPQHAIEDGPIVDGQNVDALLSFHMTKPPQQGKPSLYYILRNLKFLGRATLPGRLGLRSLHLVGAAAQRLRGAGPLPISAATDFTGYAADLLLGINPSSEFADDARREIALLACLFDRPVSLRDMFFYAYPSWQTLLGAAKPGAPADRLVNSAPFLPLWGAPLGWRDLMRPKWQVSNFIERLTQTAYASIPIPPATREAPEIDRQFFDINGATLLRDGALLDFVEPHRRQALRDTWRELFARILHGGHSNFDLLWAMRILNHDLLLRRNL